MRYLTFALLALLGLVQVGLWAGAGGLPQVMRLQAQLDANLQRNAEQKQRNDHLQAEVEDLRQGLEMVEDRARGELGMVKPDEIFVQLTARR
ncbi:cell division protein FtsB [Ideonella sp. A 288]|uniref:cell division protein FtsB n=1 Tax=Ideonella sp. A 288 TaxID=1962181 RepID=UPI000B4AFE85|nr:cell division protein FtsB [Ideonella sp. A 288]